jgi:hypothetical protein
MTNRPTGSDATDLQTRATWNALAREAGLAAEHIGIGATALGKANYAQDAFYAQAFFALSVGFERSSKLALVVDHALENSGAFPPYKTVKNYGHNLRSLLDAADQVAVRRSPTNEPIALPRMRIHDEIIDVLSKFAMNETRYYNLDFLTGDPAAAGKEDPMSAWFTRVTHEVLNLHYTDSIKKKHALDALEVAYCFRKGVVVSHTSETGRDLRTPYDASLQTSITEFAKPFTRMYVLQIARFLARLLSELGSLGYRMSPQIIPELSEFYRVFENDDREFRKRKTWRMV